MYKKRTVLDTLLATNVNLLMFYLDWQTHRDVVMIPELYKKGSYFCSCLFWEKV